MTGYRNTGYLRAVARLKPGVPFGQARAEIAAIGDRLSRSHAEDDGRGATLVTIREQLAGSIERPLLVLAGAVAFVLAIACANVASLVLGRGAARRRDLALRRAIGASRMRIFRQLLTDRWCSRVRERREDCCSRGGPRGRSCSWRLRTSRVSARRSTCECCSSRWPSRSSSGVAFGIIPALQLSRDSLTDALGKAARAPAGRAARAGRVTRWSSPKSRSRSCCSSARRC